LPAADSDEPTGRMNSWAQAAIKHAAAATWTLTYPPRPVGVSHIKVGDCYLSQRTGVTYSVASVDDAIDEVQLTIPGAAGVVTIGAIHINDPSLWVSVTP
jgi:hypothetical protein